MPVIDTTTLQQLVANEKIRWISLDTNIFIACGKDIKNSPVNDIKKFPIKSDLFLHGLQKKKL